MMKQLSIILFSLFFASSSLVAQEKDKELAVDFSSPSTYLIAGVEIDSDRPVNSRLVISISGLTVGKKIEVPGPDVKRAIRNLWDQKLFSDVKILARKAEKENEIYITIKLLTRPRLAGHFYPGLKKNQQRSLDEKLELKKGDVISEHYIQNIVNTIRSHYVDKGYANPSVQVIQLQDSMFNGNSNRLKILVDRGERLKIDEIRISGNEAFSDFRLKMLLKETKQTGLLYLFRQSKLKRDLYMEDKENLVNFYNSKGFRDAAITSDSIYQGAEGDYVIDIQIDEGNLYYFRNINFSGNTKYSSALLKALLGIKKGDVYDPQKLEANLRMNPNGIDISSLYMDNGYLFFNVMPVETRVENDSIDFEIRIYEGPQASIDRVTVSGNDRTNDHVILRELRSRPGQKFSRADIIRSQRELSNLQYFDPEQMDLGTNPDPQNGTVDLEYKVTERPSDQIELSMGWGQGQLVGVLGLSLNNFSTRNLFKKGKWGGPYPMGDGQKLSIRAQSSGRFFQSYNFSFTEPWFGGKKPNSLSLSLYHTVYTNNWTSDNPGKLKITGGSIGVGKRLQWPDDFFTLYNALSYRRYNVDGYGQILPFENGIANSVFFTHTIGRNSISQPIYPREGSNISLSLDWTVPVSLFNEIDYNNASDAERYKWIEYHKWKFNSDFYLPVAGNLVLRSSVQFGMLGRYNKNYSFSPFERFYMGGDGLTGGFQMDGRELIRLRGYENNAITPNVQSRDGSGNLNTSERGGTIYNKYTVELRYPLSLNPQATVYLLTFMEAGNNFLGYDNYNPFDLYRSAGAGLRLFLPMFGLIGFDYGFGFDGRVGVDRKQGGQFHISIGQQF